MPVISRHPRDRRILFAFGHGHMGLTYSAPTARHIAALVAGNEDAVTLAPFDIARFN
jgi:D-amino-acid dehydrogenase